MKTNHEVSNDQEVGTVGDVQDKTAPIEESMQDTKVPSVIAAATTEPIRIHPALDFQRGIGCLTARYWDGEKEGEGYVHRLITSERKCLKLPDKKGKRVDRFVIEEVPKLDEERWYKQLVEEFLRGEKADPRVAFHGVRTCFTKHLELQDPRQYDLLSLWTLGTYVYPLFETYGFLHFYGEKESGKSKTLEVLKRLAFNGLMASGISRSALMRLIQKNRPTVLMDEVEYLKSERGLDMRGFLNGVYKRGGKYWLTNKEKGFEVEAFDIYAPLAISGISELPDTVASRAVSIHMLRGKNKELINKSVRDDGAAWEFYRHKMYVMALECFAAIEEINESYIVEGISGRDFETFRPILVMARFLDELGEQMKDGPGLEDVMMAYALEGVRLKKLECGLDEFGAALLEVLQEEVTTDPVLLISKDLTPKVLRKLGWEKEKHDTKRTSEQIGGQLRRWGLKPESKLHGYNRYRITPEILKDVKERYDVSG